MVNYDCKEYLEKMHKYWNAANYLSACQLYLLDNPLLKRDLKKEDIKKKIVGHWGTVPGQTFIYTHLNRIINKYGLNLEYENQNLDNESTLEDYNIKNDDVLTVSKNDKSIINTNSNIEYIISDSQLKEKCEQIKGIFSHIDDEIIKLAIKKNRGDTEEAIIYLTAILKY